MTARADRLAAIEAREKAATGGPWKLVRRHDGNGYDSLECHKFGENLLADPTESDTTFIAHSRADVPWLVAEVRRLEAALEDIRDVTADIPEQNCEIANRIALGALKDWP